MSEKNNDDKIKFSKIFPRSFNLCIFISLIILSAHHHVLVNKLSSFLDPWRTYLILPLTNGLLTGFFFVLLNYYFSKYRYTAYRFSEENKFALFATGVIAGFCSIYIALDAWATYAVSLLILYTTFKQVKSFASKLSGLLRPSTRATTGDLAEFAVFFINLVVAFTVINISLNTIHNSLNIDMAFNFGPDIEGILDAIYFVLITMTTVGYGDIYPHTSLARIIVGLECLTSYILLGIMIGIISRGVKFPAVKD